MAGHGRVHPVITGGCLALKFSGSSASKESPFEFLVSRRLASSNQLVIVIAGKQSYGFPPHGMTGTVEMLFAGAPSISLRLMAK